jgi:hypothetical protein
MDAVEDYAIFVERSWFVCGITRGVTIYAQFLD